MCAFAGAPCEHEKRSQRHKPGSYLPKRPPLRIYRVLLTANPLWDILNTPFSVFLWQREPAYCSQYHHFFIYSDRIYFLFFLPTDVENQSSAAGTMWTEYYAYTWVCQCHMCVWWREEAGGPCVLRHQDWLVPQRQRQDVKIQQCALKTTGSSPDSWFSIQSTTWTACMLIGKDNIYG